MPVQRTEDTQCTDYTLLQAASELRDTLDAIGLLAPEWRLEQVTSKGKGWTAIALSRRDAQWLAPALAQVIAKPVLTTTVDQDTCALGLALPGHRTLLRADASASTADEVLRGLGVEPTDERTGQRLTWLLADRALSPAERHRKAAEFLGVPLPQRTEQPGVAAVWASPQQVRACLPFPGHGAWVVPVSGSLSLVVPDGTGWAPSPVGMMGWFTDDTGTPFQTMLVHWGELAGVDTRSEHGTAFWLFVLQERDRSRIPSDARDLATVLGMADRADAITEILTGGGPVEDKCAALLALAGIPSVPAGGSPADLAAWASERPGAIHVGPEDPGRWTGPPTTSTAVEPAGLRPKYRRRRAMRRIRRLAGWTEAAGWIAVPALLIGGLDDWAYGALATVAGLIVLRVVLKRALRRPKPKGRPDEVV